MGRLRGPLAGEPEVREGTTEIDVLLGARTVSTKTGIFVNTVRLIDIDGKASIPTMISYQHGKCRIGLDALDLSSSPDDIHEDFKVELGNYEPSALTRPKNYSANVLSKTALELAKDFIEALIAESDKWMATRGLPRPTRILIAEPIAMGSAQKVSDSWLTNYRSSLKRILSPYFKDKQLDFLPEPFAVFQYYRYGVRHPLVAQKTKHIALVLDFGGGTFDVSVIETTAQGDISQSGRNSRPFSAASEPIGGFFINRAIARILILENLTKKVDKGQFTQAFKKYTDQSFLASDEYQNLREDYRAFCRNVRQTIRSIERAKISICNSIANWSLEADLSKGAACRVPVPKSPFSEDGDWIEARLDAQRLREIFEKEIWTNKLKRTVDEALSRSSNELDGRCISVILLSGGSSNIRWLRGLIERDLRSRLGDADILELGENFQEIVSKGLAVECARRFYTEGAGDFRTVTYNRLCLALQADDGQLETRRYRAISDGLPGGTLDDGVLLPSASILSGLIEKPLRWKARLSAPPRRVLNYYFMRGSFDPADIHSLQNIDHQLATPRGASFGSNIEIELTVKEDGTTTPRFIYGHGQRGQGGTIVQGRPFYLDMTFGADSSLGNTYLGFDFGTSNCSLSIVQRDDVKIYKDRAHNKNWLALNELLAELPYPAAVPLAALLAEPDSERVISLGREVIESMLSLAAYIAFAEYCTTARHGHSFMLKGLQHRSAGPLWAMIRQAMNALGSKARFSRGYASLLNDPFYPELDDVISQIALEKHGKLSAGVDYPRIITIFGNVTNGVFASKLFGYFDEVRKTPFKEEYRGIFRNAKGPYTLFTDRYEYRGPFSLSSEEAFLIDPEQGEALPLSPLLIWGLDVDFGKANTRDLFFFDSERPKQSIFTYKAVQPRQEFRVPNLDEMSILYYKLSALKEKDPELQIVSGLRIGSNRTES